MSCSFGSALICGLYRQAKSFAITLPIVGIGQSLLVWVADNKLADYSAGVARRLRGR